MSTIQSNLIDLINSNIKGQANIVAENKTTGFMLREVLLALANNGAGVPIGTVVPWQGDVNSIPRGWMICNGENGTPDLRGKFIAGYHPDDTDYDAIGKFGGLKEVKLTEAQLPSHDHDGVLTIPPHTHDLRVKDGVMYDNGDDNPGGKGEGSRRTMDSTLDTTAKTEASAEINTTFNTNDAGGNQAHENRPPYWTLLYIIYVGVEGSAPEFLNTDNKIELRDWTDYSSFEYTLETSTVSKLEISSNTANLPIEIVGNKLVSNAEIPIPTTEDVVTLTVIASNGFGSNTYTLEFWRYIPAATDIIVTYSDLTFTENSPEVDPNVNEIDGWKFLLDPAVNNPSNKSLEYSVVSATPDVSPSKLPRFVIKPATGTLSTKYPISSTSNATYTVTVRTNVVGSTESVDSTFTVTVNLPALTTTNDAVRFRYDSFSSYVTDKTYNNETSTYLDAHYGRTYTLFPVFSAGTKDNVTGYRVSSSGDSLSAPSFINITTGEITISNLPLGRKTYTIIADIDDGSTSESVLSILSYDPYADQSPTCLVEGTLVSTYEGEVPIETLSKGNTLISNSIKGMPETNDVYELYDWNASSIKPIPIAAEVVSNEPHLVNKTIIVNGYLEATPDHTQVVKTGGIWTMVRMDQIKVGDYLYKFDGSLELVSSVEVNEERRTVYKLTLEDHHTFYANEVLTHNIKLEPVDGFV